MEKNYIIKSVLTLLFTAFFFTQTKAQIRIVQVDPATDKVTIHNFGGGTVNISTYWLCSQISYMQLGSLTLESGSLNLMVGSSVTVSATTDYLDDTAADLGLYDAFDFTNTAAMHDFLQWGGSFDFPDGRENVAVAKGIWGDEDFNKRANSK